MKSIKKQRNLIIIIILALLIRLIWVFKFSNKVLTSDDLYYDQTAQSIIHGEGYRNGKMFAYRPPIYPYFLATTYSIFGYNYLPVKIIQIILSLFSCVIIYRLTKKLVNYQSALFAASIFAFYPPLVRYSGELWSETLFIFLFLSVLLYLFKCYDKPNLINCIIPGILLGISSLTREISLFFIFPIGIWLYLRKTDKKGKCFIKNFSIILVSMTLIITPWIIRNYYIFKTFLPVSTNGGINFYIGNNPDASGGFLWRIPTNYTWPNDLKGSSNKEVSDAEIKIYKAGYKEGLKFIKNNPYKFVKLCFKKLFILWRPPYYKIDFNALSLEAAFRIVWLLFYFLLLFSAIPAILVNLLKFNKKWFILLEWIFLVSIVQMVTYADARYFLPIIPVLIIFSSYTFSLMVHQLAKVKINKLL